MDEREVFQRIMCSEFVSRGRFGCQWENMMPAGRECDILVCDSLSASTDEPKEETILIHWRGQGTRSFSLFS
jgi:hypothetical protein